MALDLPQSAGVEGKEGQNGRAVVSAHRPSVLLVTGHDGPPHGGPVTAAAAPGCRDRPCGRRTARVVQFAAHTFAPGQAVVRT